MYEKIGLLLLIVILTTVGASADDAASFNLADYPYEPGDQPVQNAMGRLYMFEQEGTFKDALWDFDRAEGRPMGDEEYIAYYPNAIGTAE